MDVRWRYLKAAQIHGALADETLALDLEAEPIAAAPEPKKVIWHFAWPRQIAAGLVAGLFVGLLGVGMVWAAGLPKAEARALRIAHGDFESLPEGPIAKGFPVRFGEWGGNPAEVIKEADGNRILRFLATANVKEDPDGFASNCSVFQLVDLSALHKQWSAEQSQSQFSLNLSARFRRDPAPNDADLPKPKASLRIFLFQAEPESIREAWPRVVQQAEALGKKSIKLEPGDDAATLSTSCTPSFLCLHSFASFPDHPYGELFPGGDTTGPEEAAALLKRVKTAYGPDAKTRTGPRNQQQQKKRKKK
jgi:hypothetical protein